MAFKRLLCVTIAVNKIEDSLPQYTEGLGLTFAEVGIEGADTHVSEVGNTGAHVIERPA